MDDDLCDPCLAGLLKGLSQEGVALLAPSRGREEIGLLKKDRMDVFRFDEVRYLYCLGGLGIGPQQVLFSEDHVLSVLELIAPDHFARDLFAGHLVVFLVADRGEVLFVEHVEVELLLLAFCREKAYGDIDQTETYASFPDRTGHSSTSLFGCDW